MPRLPIRIRPLRHRQRRLRQKRRLRRRPGAVGAVRARLRFFRQATLLAVALTSLLLLLFAPWESGLGAAGEETAIEESTPPAAVSRPAGEAPIGEAAAEEATRGGRIVAAGLF